MENSFPNINQILDDLNQKLQVVFDISAILKNTNVQIHKTDESLKFFLSKLDDFEKNFFNTIERIAHILEQQEIRLQRLEKLYCETGFSNN